MTLISVDEGILQVFEEHGEDFYFPVESQKEARSFVKALVSKGMSYQDLCEEINELEQNFSAWRKGIGRVGIGRRVLERINAPLQDLLDEIDEDEPTTLVNNRVACLRRTSSNSLPSSKSNGINGNNNHTATNTTQNGSNSTPLHALDRESAKEKSRDLFDAMNKNLDKTTKNLVKHLDAKDKTKEKEEDNGWGEEDALSVKKAKPQTRREDASDSSSKESSRNSTRESTPKRQMPENQELSETAKVFERIRGKKPGEIDEATTEISTEVHIEKEVTLRRNSSHDKEPEKRKSVKDLIANQELVTSEPSSPKHSAPETEKRQSTKDIVESELSEPAAAVDNQNETEEEKAIRMNEARVDRINRLAEKLADMKKRFPKGNDASVSSSSSPESSESPKSPVLDRQQNKSPVLERKSSSSLSPKPLSPLLSSRSGSESPKRTRVTSSSADSSSNRNSQVRPVSNVDITESYDSDLDIEALPEEDVTFEMKNLWLKIRTLKHKKQDCAGYLYVFSSNNPSSGNGKAEFKVGASRFPSAKLEQAQLFNPALELILQVSVSKQKEALVRARAVLESFTMPSTTDWFVTTKETIEEAVMKVADELPSGEASSC